MTKEEFENEWCKESGISLARLRLFGFKAIPCDCEYDGCRGWQMETQTEQTPDGLRGNTKEVREGE